MKYKILLTGENKITINDFFTQMDSAFECQSCSMRFEDVTCHLKYFQPDAFVYCMRDESRELMTNISNIKARLARNHIPMVIIGIQEDCDMYSRFSTVSADLTLIKPITALKIQASIVELIETRAQELQEAETNQQPAPQKPAEPVPAFTNNAISRPQMVTNSTRKHILVIDDDAGTLRLIKNHLRDDYDVATAISGNVAMKFLETKHTDLILMDYEMPEEDGAQVTKRIRNQNNLKDIPIIFLTGVSEREKIQNVLVMKPQGYLLKPIDRDKLLASIRNIIG